MDRLTYIGHATTLLRLDSVSILTDPLLRRLRGPVRRQVPPPSTELVGTPDLVLISHLHRDHLDLPSLRRLPARTPLVISRGGRRWAARGGARQIREIGIGETISVGRVEVTAVRAAHDGHRDNWGSGVQALGYVIRSDAQSVYFAGDTDLLPEMAQWGTIDIALLPVWGWGPSLGPGHLDPERAAQALELLRPRIAVPIHWGTLYPLGVRWLRPGPLARPPHEFARWASRLAPEVDVRILQPGTETLLVSR